MIKNEKPFRTEKEQLAASLTNTGDDLIMDLRGTTASEVIRDNAIKKANKEMEVYADAYNKHVEKLKDSINQLSLNPEDLEILPIGNYVLIKEFSTNPFLRIVRDSKTGLITDIGGMAPVFKNTDSGETDIEESFIITGAIQEIGPECKWVQPGDAVFYTKASAVPVPFYRAGLVLVNETRILAVINENLTKRFEDTKKKLNPETININELPEFLGDTIEEKIDNYEAWKKRGYKLIEKENV